MSGKSAATYSDLYNRTMKLAGIRVNPWDVVLGALGAAVGYGDEGNIGGAAGGLAGVLAATGAARRLGPTASRMAGGGVLGAVANFGTGMAMYPLIQTPLIRVGGELERRIEGEPAGPWLSRRGQ